MRGGAKVRGGAVRAARLQREERDGEGGRQAESELREDGQQQAAHHRRLDDASEVDEAIGKEPAATARLQATSGTSRRTIIGRRTRACSINIAARAAAVVILINLRQTSRVF